MTTLQATVDVPLIQPIPAGSRIKDLTDDTFGCFTVLGYAGRGKRRPMWQCQCHCGRVQQLDAIVIRRSASRNRSGCWYCRKGRLTHGFSDKAVHRIWIHMRQRCENPDDAAYADYGGRGISVCLRWQTFENFLADMGEPPRGLTLERCDVNGDYTPTNCVWATRQTQSRNRRHLKRYTFNGQSLLLCEWADATGIPLKGLWDRVSRGWTFDEAISRPYHVRKSRLSGAENAYRRRVRKLARDAANRGRIFKATVCQQADCRRTDVQAHHHRGYDQLHWLDVIWLCPSCHRRAEAYGT